MDPDTDAGFPSDTVAHRASATPVEPTGVAAVDQVLDDVAGAEHLPVKEHVAVFERAHEQLRRALDAPSESAEDA